MAEIPEASSCAAQDSGASQPAASHMRAVWACGKAGGKGSAGNPLVVSIAESDEEADISTASGQDGAVSTASAHGGGDEETVWSMNWTTIQSPPPPPVAKTTSSTPHESSEISSNSFEVEASSLGSDDSAGLLLRDAKLSYHWEVYKLPDTEKLWFWNSMTDEYFHADQPGSWTLYRTEQGERWWWNESTKEWFWQ